VPKRAEISSCSGGGTSSGGAGAFSAGFWLLLPPLPRFPRDIKARPTRTDEFSVRVKPRLILVAMVASLGILAGCGYDTGSDLSSVVEDVTPVGAQLLTSCGGSSGLIEPPSHGCTFFTPGEGGAVTSAVARALHEQGFTVACPTPGQITAVRGDVRVLAQVTQYGSVVASGGVANVSGTGYRPRGSQLIPARSVALEIDASRLSKASASLWRSRARERGRCETTLPKPNLAENCVNWWNHVGRRTGERALRLRARPPVQIRTDWGIERATCSYTLRTSASFLGVTARFERGDWTWPRLREVSPPGTFRPNARLNEYGRLDLIV
jgi:hypothetical protein